MSKAEFKAKLLSEALEEEIEDNYVTACYWLMQEFGWTIDEIKKLPVQTFLVLIEEGEKQAKKLSKKTFKNGGTKA